MTVDIKLGRWERTDAKERGGGNGRVYQVRDTTAHFAGLAAMKVLRADRLDRYDRFRREVAAATSLEHHHLAKVIDAHLPAAATADDLPFFITPWCERGTLHDRVEAGIYRGDGVAALLVLEPVLQAVAYMHGAGRFHRDIKPRNVLIDSEERLILCDFGLCFDLEDQHLTLSSEVVGSIGYRAPEYMRGRLAQTDHAPGDIFSLGKTIWVAVAGEAPPDGPVLDYPQYNLVQRFGRSLDTVQQLVQWMTRDDVGRRPTIDDVLREVDAILRPQAAPSKKADVAGAIKALNRFVETDPEYKARSRATNDDELVKKRIHEILLRVRAAVETNESVITLVSTFPPEDGAKFGFRVNGPQDFHPGEHEELARAIGIESLPAAQAAYIHLWPLDPHLQDRVQMLTGTWSISRHGLKVLVNCYVYSRAGGKPIRAVRGIHFETSLESPRLAESLVGSVETQVAVFVNMAAVLVRDA